MEKIVLRLMFCAALASNMVLAASAQSRLAGYQRGDQVNSVLYSGSDGHIHELSLSLGAKAWGQADLSLVVHVPLSGAPLAAGSPAAYVRADEYKKVSSVVYRGFDNHIYELYLDFGAWHSGDLTKIAHAPLAAGDPVPYVRDDDQNCILYRGFDNHIHELFLILGSPILGTWATRDLFVLAGVPPASAAAGNPAHMQRYDATDSVVYRGVVDSHIHVLSLSFSFPPGPSLPVPGTWSTDDLSARTGAPFAVGDPAAYMRSDQISSVVYRTLANHIQELFLDQSGGSAPNWGTGDLSALTFAPPAAGEPAAYRRFDDVNSVVYRGFDDHIHELFLRPIVGADGKPLGRWHTGDLSALAGAPLAAGDPAAYRRSDDVNSVVYRGSDQHIHELYLRSGATAWGTGDLPVVAGHPPAQ